MEGLQSNAIQSRSSGASSAGIEYTSSPFYIFDFNKNTNKSNNEEKKTSNNIENNTNNNESINEDN